MAEKKLGTEKCCDRGMRGAVAELLRFRVNELKHTIRGSTINSMVVSFDNGGIRRLLARLRRALDLVNAAIESLLSGGQADVEGVLRSSDAILEEVKPLFQKRSRRTTAMAQRKPISRHADASRRRTRLG